MVEARAQRFVASETLCFAPRRRSREPNKKKERGEGKEDGDDKAKIWYIEGEV